MPIYWSPKNSGGAGKTLYRSNLERGKIIAKWWAGKGTLPHSFWETSSREGRIRLFYLIGKEIKLAGGLKRNKSYWITFEDKDDNKLIHVFESDQTTLVNSFYLVKDGQAKEVPEPAQKSPKQLALERGKKIRAWWIDSGPLPECMEIISTGRKKIALTSIDGKRKRLSGMPKGNKPYWLIFEEKGKDKLVHIYEAAFIDPHNNNLLVNSYYLVKDNEILEDPKPVQMTSSQLARLSRQPIIAWLTGNAPPPYPIKKKTSKVGRIQVFTLEDNKRTITGGLKREQSYWLTFEERGKDKLVHVYKPTFIDAENNNLRVNSFYLVKDGEILEDTIPLQKSPKQLGQERGRLITQWWTDNGPLPEPYLTTTGQSGGIYIPSISKRKPKALMGGLEKNTNYWLTFQNFGGSKIIHVYAADKKTMATSFYLVKKGKVLKEAEPLQRTSFQAARKRGQTIARWWKENGPIPQNFATTSSKSLNILLTSWGGEKRHLSGQLEKKMPCWVIFEETGRDKLVHVYKQTFIDAQNNRPKMNSFYLAKNGRILEDPEPVEKSAKQLARERGKSILEWWTGNRPLPQPFQTTTSREGRILVTSLYGKQRTVSGKLGRKKTRWVSFIEVGIHKIILVFGKDKTTFINAFYLVKNGTILTKPEMVGSSPPVQAAPSQRQELRFGFGRGNYDDIAADYRRHLLGIAPYWVALARNSLLLQLQKQGKISPFDSELSLGAGPSTSYTVWTNLAQNVQVVDLDQNQKMLQQGINPTKILATMEAPLPLRNNSFDLVTIDSTLREASPESRFSALQEARRT
jgi:hypothetical protein